MDLLSDRFEHGSGLYPAGDEGRHPPQRSLLLCDAAQFFSRFGAFHGSRDEFGEPRYL
jgi:hypothetical protein